VRPFWWWGIENYKILIQEKDWDHVVIQMSSNFGKEMRPMTRRLGFVLRQHRIRLRLSLGTVASAAGITPLALHNLETGKTSSRSDTYERVAEAMGLEYVMITLEAHLLAQREDNLL